MFSGDPWEACPFRKGSRGGKDLEERGDERDWEDKREDVISERVRKGVPSPLHCWKDRVSG